MVLVLVALYYALMFLLLCAFVGGLVMFIEALGQRRRGRAARGLGVSVASLVFFASLSLPFASAI